MKKNAFYLLLALVPWLLASCKKVNDVPTPQVTAAGIDTRGLDYYIKVAETLQSKQKPPQADWDSLFVTPFYKRVIDLGGVKPEALKEEMRLVYTEQTLTTDQQKRYAHHRNYKANLAKLKSYASSLKDGSVRPLIKQYLFPYLPARLQKEERIPTIVYTYYFAEDATAYENALVLDALLSYKMDSYAKGLLAAHESYHFITGQSVTQRVKLSQIRIKSFTDGKKGVNSTSVKLAPLTGKSHTSGTANYIFSAQPKQPIEILINYYRLFWSVSPLRFRARRADRPW